MEGDVEVMENSLPPSTLATPIDLNAMKKEMAEHTVRNHVFRDQVGRQTIVDQMFSLRLPRIVLNVTFLPPLSSLR